MHVQEGERAQGGDKRRLDKHFFFLIIFLIGDEISRDSLSQSEQHQAGALGAADHLGDTDFLFLQQVSGTFPNVRDAEPDAVLAEVRDTEGGSENMRVWTAVCKTLVWPGEKK